MGNLNLVDLFKWKRSVDVIDDKGTVVGTVWIRVLGDWDLQQAYKLARAASNKKRLALRDPSTLDYIDEVLPVEEFTREEKCEVIRSANQGTFINDAATAVVRPDLPKMEEISSNPDNPSLEDQEEFDKLLNQQQDKYEEAIQKYIDERMGVLNKQLEKLPDKELTKQAMEQISNVVPFSIFMDELNTQKILRGTYLDEFCKERAFNTEEEVRDLHQLVKQQLVQAFGLLDIGPDDIKNS